MSQFKFIVIKTSYTFGEIEAESLDLAVSAIEKGIYPVTVNTILGKEKIKVASFYNFDTAEYDNEI